MDFFEADPGPEAEGPGAEAANRARRQLDNGEFAREADTQLGVDRSLLQPEGPGGIGHGPFEGGESLRRMSGRRDVDGLLKERTVERVGFVEDGEDVEGATVEEAFDGDFHSPDELLDEQRLGLADDGSNPGLGGRGVGVVVDPDHPLGFPTGTPA